MMKKNLEKQEREACSFKPKILEYKKSETVSPVKPEVEKNPEQKQASREMHTQLSTFQPTADRCRMLYELSKKVVKRPDKPTDLYKYEKERKEYTFAPELRKEESKNITIQAGSVDKTIERVRKARMERERVKKALERCGDNTGMKFAVNKTKFGGSFQQFGLGKEISMSQQRSGNKFGSENSGQMQAPFSEDITPQLTKIVDSAAPQAAEIKPEHNNETEKPAQGTFSPIQSQTQPAVENEVGPSNSAPVPAAVLETKEQPAPAEETKKENPQDDALLFIDVNLGQQQKRIVVYKGDTASELAERFAKENG